MPCPELRWPFSLALFLVLTAFGRANDPPSAQGPPRVDRLGDPLPEGALARLGTERFRMDGFLAALSPDGKLLAVADGWEAVRLLDAVTGRELRRLTAGSMPSCGPLLFTPDSRRLAVGRFRGLHIFDVVGDGVDRLELGGDKHLAVAFSADGKVLASGTMDDPGNCAVAVWEVASGKRLARFGVLPASFGGLIRVSLSADGNLLAAWGMSRGRRDHDEMPRSVRLWDVAAGKELRQIETDDGMVWEAALSPDGRTLGVLEGPGQVSTWEVATGRLLRRWAGRECNGALLCFSPDGKVLAAGVDGGVVQLWEIASGRRLAVPPGPACDLFGLAFLPGGQILAAGRNGRALRLWEVLTGRERTPRGGPVSAVESLGLSPDGRTLFSAGSDGVRRWDLPSGSEGQFLPTPPIERNCVMAPLALSPDGRFALCGALYGDLWRVVEVAAGREIFSIDRQREVEEKDRLRATITRTRAFAFSADGSRLAVFGGDGFTGGKALLRVWDVVTGEELQALKTEGDERLCVALSSDGRRAVTVATSAFRRPCVLRVWDLGTGKTVCRGEARDCGIDQIAFSADGVLLASAGWQRGIRLWDAATGTVVREFEGGGELVTAGPIFSPDDRLLATSVTPHKGQEAHLRVWELASGKVRCEFRGHRGAVHALAFSPDCRILVSGGQDTTVLLWDVATPPGLVIRPGARLTPPELASLWFDLEGDAHAAHRALARLAASPTDAVGLVRRELKPVAALEPKEVERLIADLDAESFEARQKAGAVLAQAGRAIRPALVRALAANPSAEKRQRLRELLDALSEVAPPPGMVRPIRAVELLERIGTPEARQALQALAGGAAEASLTLQAQAALRRLQARPAAP
jgi:WD40 repeat protein